MGAMLEEHADAQGARGGIAIPDHTTALAQLEPCSARVDGSSNPQASRLERPPAGERQLHAEPLAGPVAKLARDTHSRQGRVLQVELERERLRVARFCLNAALEHRPRPVREALTDARAQRVRAGAR